VDAIALSLLCPEKLCVILQHHAAPPIGPRDMADDHAAAPPQDISVEQSTIRKVCLRLVPFVAAMFVINFLDRTAISFAGPNGLTRDLSMTVAQFGLAAGIFFASYILLGIPSNLALHRFGARRWLGCIMVSWGIVSLLFTWVKSLDQLYVLRLLLGATESGFAPGAIMFLSLWVPARHRARILGLFYISQPLSIVIGAPIASLLIGMDGIFGLAGWRLMFLGLALPAIIIGFVTWFFLADSPAQARWLDAGERHWLTAELAAEDRTKAQGGGHRVGAVFGNLRVWVLAVIYFGLVYGLYALTFFLPTIINGFEGQFGVKFDVLQKGLITAIPYLPAAAAVYAWSHFTRRGVRAWHIALPALIGALSIPCALYMQAPGFTVAVITVTASAIFAALPVFWTFPTRMLGGAGAATGIALINTIGNVGGFAAPYITGVMKDATGSYIGSMFVVGGVMLLSAILPLLLTARPSATA
jgi:predicted MFS family arabinose efflux permease